MEVILLEKLSNLGSFGDTVQVKPGYARNFLIPKGKALPATAGNKKLFDTQRAEFEQQQAQKHKKAEERIERLARCGTITMQVKAGAEGKLFGAVTVRDLVEHLSSINFAVKREELRTEEKYIKHAGEYEVRFSPVEARESGLESKFLLIVEGV